MSWTGRNPRPLGATPINICRNDNSAVVTSELPGVTPSGITIWQRRERAYGSFSRAVQLPFRIDPDKVEARSHNGILEIELQRLEGGPVEKDRDPPRLGLSQGVSNGPRSENCRSTGIKRSKAVSHQPLARCSWRLPTSKKPQLSCRARRGVGCPLDAMDLTLERRY